MEFDKNTHLPDDQILESSKKIVITPLGHEDLIRNEQKNAQVASVHSNGQVIGNIDSDTEITQPTSQPVSPATIADQKATALLAQHKAAQPVKKTKASLSVIAGIIVIFILVFALLYR